MSAEMPGQSEALICISIGDGLLDTQCLSNKPLKCVTELCVEAMRISETLQSRHFPWCHRKQTLGLRDSVERVDLGVQKCL